MPLAPGAQIGPYSITAAIGAGGMGEVFRARDTKLNRDIAIKVLPAEFARDAERVARFKREAQILASLNHPNIAGIYGLEEDPSTGTVALVMEYVDGEDLAQRLARGAIPVDEALGIAKQIAEGLEEAHEHGIIHRDLKPANVKVTPDGKVKILDFGLAKAMDPTGLSSANPNVSHSPTLTHQGTSAGMIVGTAAYMSPEQARGKTVDKRADIWAFGVVLFEMLTGERLFTGETVSDVLAALLTRDPDFAALPAKASPRIASLVRRCLVRDPKQRLRDIGEARVELAKIADGPGDAAAPPLPGAASSRSSLLPWAVALVAVIVAGLIGWTTLGTSSSGTVNSPQHLRLNLDPAESLLGSEPAEIRVGSRRPSRTALAFSPDGQWLAFTGEQGGVQQLFVRDMRRDAAVAIAGTAGADNPFFSPDGTSIGFWSDGALRKAPVEGGPVVEICKSARIHGADWGPDGRILFSAGETLPSSGMVGNTGAPVIRIVAAAGGKVSDVTALNVSAGEDAHQLPRWVTADWFLYTARARGDRRLIAQRMGGTERRVLVEDATDGRLVAKGRYLVFMRGATLMAAPFDTSSVQTTGAVQGVIDGIQVSLNGGTAAISVGAGEFTVSESGTLAYLPGRMYPDRAGTLTWLDRQGRTEPVTMEPRSYIQARLSPDGRRAVVSSFGQAGSALWVHDFDRQATVKLPLKDGRAIWTPDGKALVIGAVDGLYRVPADGSSAPERLPGGLRHPFAAGWSHDGRELVYVEVVSKADGGNGTHDIFAVSLADKKVRPLVQTPGQDAFPAVSPDGKWLAYSSDESGQPEVMVQPYGGGARVPVSINGGTAPCWTRDGRTLIYSKLTFDATNARMEMWEVPLKITDTIVPGPPRKFADLTQEDFGAANPVANYDVAADGRVLGMTRRSTMPKAATSLNVITNWFEELRAKAPAKE